MAEPEMINRANEVIQNLTFKGLDGKEYADPQALEQANRNWFAQNQRYISAVTGKEYSDYDVLRQEEADYWERQKIQPKTIINQDKKELKI